MFVSLTFSLINDWLLKFVDECPVFDEFLFCNKPFREILSAERAVLLFIEFPLVHKLPLVDELPLIDDMPLFVKITLSNERRFVNKLFWLMLNDVQALRAEFVTPILIGELAVLFFGLLIVDAALASLSS